jgi:hypothetical protein
VNSLHGFFAGEAMAAILAAKKPAKRKRRFFASFIGEAI